MTDTKKDYCFFLGGMDLEMLAIEELLTNEGKEVINKQLNWKNARLSAYRKEIKTQKKDHVLVFIELSIDDKAILQDLEDGIDYRMIDHHGENDIRNSSIEQVLELIQVEPTDEQIVIAINDKAYIPGLKSYGLTQSAIREVRKRDWMAQGIIKTDEDYKNTVEKIKTYFSGNFEDACKIILEDNLAIIEVEEGLSFTPIVDHLTLENKKTTHLILFNHNSLTYYGPAAKILADKFSKEISNQTAYNGGGTNGYFGLDMANRSEDSFQMANKIARYLRPEYQLHQSIDRAEDIYSYHIFSFPFKIKSFPVDFEMELMNKNNSIASFKDLLQLNPQWVNQPYQLTAPIYYNEYNYFYDFTRDALFDTDPNSNEINFFNFDLSKEKDTTYQIQLAPGVNETIDKIYILDIESLSLQLHKTGVGVLTFHLKNTNKDQSKPTDIQLINQFGRRLYPPFLMTPDTIEEPGDEESEGLYSKANWTRSLEGEQAENNRKKLVLGVQDAELAKSLTVLGEREDFKAFGGQISSKPYSPPLPKFLQKILWADQKPPYELRPILDDRMFVISWYGHDFLAGYLGQSNSEGQANFLNLDWWYEYVFVDNPGAKSCPYPPMAKSLIESSTNARWSPYGTLYGVTRYSFVLLTTQWSTLKKNNAYFLLHHLQTLYFKMVNLCLIQKATLLMFSDQIKQYTNQPLKTQAVLKNYSIFVNRQYFREVTAQIQGIELYQLLHSQMGIPEEIVFLERELQSHHNILLLQESEESNKKNERLNQLLAILSTILAVPGVSLAYYGINAFNDELAPFNRFALALIIVLIAMASIVVYFALKAFINRENQAKTTRKEKSLFIVAFICFAFIIGLPFFFERTENTKQDNSKIKSSSQKNPLENDHFIQDSIPERLRDTPKDTTTSQVK